MQELNDTEKQNIASTVRRYLEVNKKTQSDISSIIQVDQSLISRVLNLKFKRMTPPIIRLYDYANMHTNRAHKLPKRVNDAIMGYLTAGGDATLLCRLLDTLTGASSARSPSLSQRSARRRKKDLS